MDAFLASMAVPVCILSTWVHPYRVFCHDTLLLDSQFQEWLTPHALENTLAENAAANGAAGGRAAIEADDSTSMTDVTREFNLFLLKTCLNYKPHMISVSLC